MRRLTDVLRVAIPANLAARAPRRARRRIVRARIRAGRYEDLQAFLGAAGDPLFGSTFWTAVDQLLETPQVGGFDALAPLAVTQPPFGEDVLKALRLIDRNGHGAAVARFNDLGRDHRHGPFERMCARCWAMFLELRSETPPQRVERAIAAPIVQFWDTPRAPDEVEALMSRWRRVGPTYLRFDDRTAREFLEREFGAGDVFDDAAHPAIRADLFRLGFLTARAGCYIDADAKRSPNAVKTLAALEPTALTLGFSTAQMHLHPQNEFLTSSGGHPLIEACFEEACRRIRRGGFSVQALAGGHMMADVARDLFDRGRLGRVVALTRRRRQDDIFTQPALPYKGDARNWRIWDQDRDRY